MVKPCKTCPFLPNAKFGYDRDAMERLDEGREPSCHSIVGLDVIFDDILPSDQTICKGYLGWLNKEPGFVKPVAAKEIPMFKHERIVWQVLRFCKKYGYEKAGIYNSAEEAYWLTNGYLVSLSKTIDQAFQQGIKAGYFELSTVAQTGNQDILITQKGLDLMFH